MAITHNEVQVQWSGANTLDILKETTGVSDVVAINTATIAANISVQATNAEGTPDHTAQMSIYVQYSTGDTDQDAADEYDTAKHSGWLGQLDTSDATGETPAQLTAAISPAASNIKIQAVNESDSGGDTITVSARLIEIRAT